MSDARYGVNRQKARPRFRQAGRCTTEATVAATETANVPKAVTGSGVRIFVAGITYDATAVRTVTITHWFVPQVAEPG